MRVFWLVATPWDIAGAASTTVRACSCDLAQAVTMNGSEWLPVLASGPSFSTEMFDGAAIAGVDSTRGSIDFTAQLGEIDQWAGYGWSQRGVQIYTGLVDVTNPTAPVWPTWGALTKIFDGVVDAFDPNKATLSLAATLPSGKVAASTYSGAGGVNGATEIKGNVVPWASGRHLNRPAVLVDPALQLYQVHGYGAIEELTNVREAGTILTQTRVTHSTSSALAAATVQPTEIHVCLAAGMFRIGFEPIGTITADFKGDKGASFSARPGAVIKRLLTATGWSTGAIAQDSLDDLDATYPYDVTCWDDGGADVLDLITDIIQPLGGYWDVDNLGTFYVGVFLEKASADFTIGEPGALKDYDALDIDEMPTRPPFWRNRLGYGFNPQVFSATELAVNDALVDALSAIDAAQAAAEDAQATADGKIGIFLLPTAPAAADSSEGDIWVDSDDGHREHLRITPITYGGTSVTYNGVTVEHIWAVKSDQRIGQALLDAAGAQATADGKAATFYSETQPVAEALGDLWYQESTETLKRWNGSSWIIVSTKGAPAGTNVAGTAATVVADGANAANNGLNSDGTVKAGMVIAESFSGNVLQEFVSASATDVDGTTSGQEVLRLEGLTILPSQGGYVHIILNARVGRLNGSEWGGLYPETNVCHLWLQRSPAGANSWTHLKSYLVYSTKSEQVSFNVTPPSSDTVFLTYIAGMTVSVAAQFIDQPASDGDYDYRWVASKVGTPGASPPSSTTAARVYEAQALGISIKVAA